LLALPLSRKTVLCNEYVVRLTGGGPKGQGVGR
jgi:hypothetical protein